jgi:hypothetical protein
LLEDRVMTQADMSFRAAAEECRRLAAKTIDPVERQELQRIADQWLKLAQVAGVAQEHRRLGANSLEHEGTPAQAHFADRDPGQREL